MVLDVTSAEASGRLSIDFTENTSGLWLRKYLDRRIHPITNFNKYVFKLCLQHFPSRRANNLKCLFKYEFCPDNTLQRIF